MNKVILVVIVALIAGTMVAGVAFADDDKGKKNEKNPLSILEKRITTLEQNNARSDSFFDIFTELGFTADSFFDIFTELQSAIGDPDFDLLRNGDSDFDNEVEARKQGDVDTLASAKQYTDSQVTNPDWADLTGIPADIADGDQVGLQPTDSFFDVFAELRNTDHNLEIAIDEEGAQRQMADSDLQSQINSLSTSGASGTQSRTLRTEQTQELSPNSISFKIIEQTFNMPEESNVFITANTVGVSGPSEIVLKVDGTIQSRSLVSIGSFHTTQSLGWTGVLAAGDHVITVETSERDRSLSAQRYCNGALTGGCTINTLILQ